eukprot:TRINITY_DN1921_c0_g1_i1.p2 TRINITY_DN1921_c0_g1~~TRINITY_DN1921_c0_g1_i1.p2  ORF type:complete len:133 (+),score=19.11 TRINITY_DN1921_c0_g1_i1:334-732(+)
MMFGYANQTMGLTQAWKFNTPAAFVSVTPMAVGQCVYTSITATQIATGSTYTSVLRAGWGSFGSLCDEGCSSTWGSICLKTAGKANGVAGGYSDFPYFATFANGVRNDCSRSDETYAATTCTLSRAFVILVR